MYEGYDLPPHLSKPQGTPVKWADLLASWSLLEGTFHSILGIDLEDVWRRKSWRWFKARVSFLLSTDTPLARYFAPEDDTQKAEAPHE